MAKLRLTTGQRAVTAAGTPERIVEGQSKNRVMSVTITALNGNAGNIYVTGPSQVTAITTQGVVLAAGVPLVLDVHDFLDGYIDLNEIWIDADNNGEGVEFVGFEAI